VLAAHADHFGRDRLSDRGSGSLGPLAPLPGCLYFKEVGST
jgi:hypothetical protein